MICRTADELQEAFDSWLSASVAEIEAARVQSAKDMMAVITDRMRNHPVYGRHSRGYRKHVRRMKKTGGSYSTPPVVRTVDLTKSIWTGKFTYSSNVRVTIGE